MTKEKVSKTLLLTDEQKYLAELFEFGCLNEEVRKKRFITSLQLQYLEKTVAEIKTYRSFYSIPWLRETPFQDFVHN